MFGNCKNKTNIGDKPEHKFTRQFTISMQKEGHQPNSKKLPRKRKLTWVGCIHRGKFIKHGYGAGGWTGLTSAPPSPLASSSSLHRCHCPQQGTSLPPHHLRQRPAPQPRCDYRHGWFGGILLPPNSDSESVIHKNDTESSSAGSGSAWYPSR